MTGVMFYLDTDVPLEHGHAIFIDSEWALTAISQQPPGPQSVAMLKAYFDSNPEVATDMNNLALLLKEQGHYDEARPLYEQAIEIRKKERRSARTTRTWPRA